MCKQLKNSKMTGSILCTTVSHDHEQCCATVETVSNKKIEQATYIVQAVTAGEEYMVRKLTETGEVERYSVNLWNDTCECDGYANGYRCRHLRLVPALRAKKKLN